MKIHLKVVELATQRGTTFVTLKFNDDDTANSALEKIAAKLKLKLPPSELQRLYALLLIQNGKKEYLRGTRTLNSYNFHLKVCILQSTIT